MFKMDKQILLLLISVACLCDAGLPYYDSNGFETSGSEEHIEETVDELSCGMIVSSTGAQFKMASRTIDGTVTKYNEFPWMVILLSSKDQQCALGDSSCWTRMCTGSLISSKVLLTVGWCSNGEIRLKARAGDWNLDTFEEKHPYQERLIAKTIVHPSYNHATFQSLRYDAVLLFVDSPYTSADNIGFICLPPPNFVMTSASCKVASFRPTEGGVRDGQEFLQVVDVNHVDHNQCEKTIRENVDSGFILHDSVMCAVYLNNERCRGLYSSLLMCLGENHYYARGMLTWRYRCNVDNLPDIYTDVSNVRSWIDQEMRANGFNTDTYTYVAYRK